MILFKYLSPTGVLKVLERQNEVAVRFGLPRSYNDPYELFLQPNAPLQSEEHRAFYEYFLRDILQAPVTCFSRRPESVAMWAHYGRESAGACLGFDEDLLTDQFPLAYVEDVSYSDEPAQIDSGVINHAFTTGKRRHTLWLLAAAHRAAYFMKRAEWQYELERRLVVNPSDVEAQSEWYIARLQPRALKYIILGAKAQLDVRKLCETRAKQFGIPLLEMRIGKRTYQPFFTVADGTAMMWDGAEFQVCADTCAKCGEPCSETDGDGCCEWCGINEEVRRTAPQRSMLTASLHYGIDKGIPLAFEGLVPKGRLTKDNDNSAPG